METLTKTATIIPEKIWEKEVNIKGKGSPTKKTFIKYKNCIFSCFGSPPKGIEEGKKCEIEYDANSKYTQKNEDGTVFFYNLVKPKIRMSDIMEKLEEIEKKIDNLQTIQLTKNQNSSSKYLDVEDLNDENIPLVEEEDIPLIDEEI